jgi:hypothetical protein
MKNVANPEHRGRQRGDQPLAGDRASQIRRIGYESFLEDRRRRPRACQIAFGDDPRDLV